MFKSGEPRPIIWFYAFGGVRFPHKGSARARNLIYNGGKTRHNSIRDGYA